MNTTLADSAPVVMELAVLSPPEAVPPAPSPAADKIAARDDCRELVRASLVAFVARYGWYDRGEQFVGTPENRVPAKMAIENTLEALWKGGCK